MVLLLRNIQFIAQFIYFIHTHKHIKQMIRLHLSHRLKCEWNCCIFVCFRWSRNTFQLSSVAVATGAVFIVGRFFPLFVNDNYIPSECVHQLKMWITSKIYSRTSARAQNVSIIYAYPHTHRPHSSTFHRLLVCVCVRRFLPHENSEFAIDTFKRHAICSSTRDANKLCMQMLMMMNKCIYNVSDTTLFAYSIDSGHRL